jgi:hypothetical protein
MALILDGTNGLSDVDGSAATPAIRGSDANTGVFFGADIIGFSEGGTECARFNADAQFVAAAGTASLPVITTTGDVNTGIFFPAADTIAFAEGGAEAMRIDSSGNLFVGKTTDSISTVGWIISPGGTGSAVFTQAASNEIFIWNNTATTGTAIVDFRTAGTSKGRISWNNTNTTYATTSDYRLKHDIQPMTGALAKVAALKPVTYKWNADDSQSQGFIAHELQEVVPECVTGEKDAVDAEGNPQYQGIDTSFLVATLTAAIQEQQAIITALTARVEALEGAQA